jgi:hypothetical protein
MASENSVPTARAVRAVNISSYIFFLKHGSSIIPTNAIKETITIAIVP